MIGRTVVSAALLLSVAYGGVCLALAALQDRLIFQPDPVLTRTPADRDLAFEDVWLETADGTTVHGWYVPAATTGRRHVLFLHGNAGNLSHRLYTVEVLHALGHPVLLIDYRGYGASAGRPSEPGLALDARAGWDHLVTARGIRPADIVIYGRSLGGAVAARLAAKVAPGALVLESTFTRLRDIAATHYPYVPVDALLQVEFDTLAAIPGIACPVLVAHSPDDDIVPVALGHALAEAAGTRGKFVALRGDHNRAFRASRAAYHPILREFLGTRE
jgi:uncharacterized protein